MFDLVAGEVLTSTPGHVDGCIACWAVWCLTDFPALSSVLQVLLTRSVHCCCC